MSETATYKPERCYRCGGQMGAFTLKDIWDMRIDGQLHKVPVYAVPCKKCLNCDVCLLDGASDEPVMWCQQQYMNKNGLNTPAHKLRRVLRRFVQRWWDRWNYWRRNRAN